MMRTRNDDPSGANANATRPTDPSVEEIRERPIEPVPCPDPETLRPAVEAFQPVAEGDRIGSVDVLRGVAILGILAINIVAFAMPLAALGNPMIYGRESLLDMGTWVFTHLFFEQKFISIFSMLFGAGLALMAGRAEARGQRFRGRYYRRLMWLLLIGMVHAYLIWYGDILVTYALCGLIPYPLRKRSPRTLIIIGVILLLVPPILTSLFGKAMESTRDQATEIAALVESGAEITSEQETVQNEWENTRKRMAPTPEDLTEQIDAMRGDYGAILDHQIPQAVIIQIFTLFMYGLWRVVGLMLIGMALMKLGVLSAKRSPSFYRRTMAIGYGLGLPLSGYGAWSLIEHDFDPIHAFLFGSHVTYVASLLVALGHIALVMWLCQSDRLSGLRARLAAIGRAALSNYLLHSVVMTAIFYGWGIGLFGHLSRFALMGFVVAMWLLQLAISKPWLERYRFGPMEWLWRSLTYWRRQPMRRRPARE